MAEKRFMTNEVGCIVDILNKGKNYDGQEIVDLMNRIWWQTQRFEKSNKELLEENEQLKSKYSEQCTQFDFLKDENQHMRELVNENEQLKQVIAENEKLIQSTYEELTKLRCIKKNLSRIKTQWDWIMEVIQYG